MIDLHSHLDLYQNALSLLPKVSKRNIFTLVVTTSPRAWIATSRVFSGYENIKVALGLHPEIVEQKKNEIELLVNSISETKFLGEIGLDGSNRFRKSYELQKSILDDVLKESERQGGRVMSIHSRAATSQVLDFLERYPGAGKPILHWFSGTIKEVKRAISMGCWFSVGPAMLKSAKGFRILKELPIEKILPETDGPFVTEESLPLMPWEGIKISNKIEEITGQTIQEIYLQMEDNLNVLLDSNNKNVDG